MAQFWYGDNAPAPFGFGGSASQERSRSVSWERSCLITKSIFCPKPVHLVRLCVRCICYLRPALFRRVAIFSEMAPVVCRLGFVFSTRGENFMKHWTCLSVLLLVWSQCGDQRCRWSLKTVCYRDKVYKAQSLCWNDIRFKPCVISQLIFSICHAVL